VKEADDSAIRSSLDSRVVIPESVLYREVGGESVLLDLESSRYFALDEVGTRIWMELAAHGSPRRATAEVVRRYDVEGENAERDLLDLLAQLAREGLIRIENEEAQEAPRTLSR